MSDPRPSRWRAVASALLAGMRALAGPMLLERSGLERCPKCGTDRVSPVEWEVETDELWALTLRCGECGGWRDTVATNEQVADYEVVLDRHQRVIERAIAQLDSERMAAELECFVRALSNDLIDAADFAS